MNGKAEIPAPSPRVWKYDTHAHTSESSKCGQSSAEEMIRAYSALGYDGVFITDHFFNGNSNVPKHLPWDVRIQLFLKGWRAAKRAGDAFGVSVFFGFEVTCQGNDFLIYGLDEAWLTAHSDIDRAPIKEFLQEARADGGFVVHAHPFREDPHVPLIRLIPDVTDAVEVLNANRKPMHNARAEWYAESYGFPRTAGSDAHHPCMIKDGGILTREPIRSAADYVEAVRRRRIAALTGANSARSSRFGTAAEARGGR